jgi:hypothetical protein
MARLVWRTYLGQELRATPRHVSEREPPLDDNDEVELIAAWPSWRSNRRSAQSGCVRRGAPRPL